MKEAPTVPTMDRRSATPQDGRSWGGLLSATVLVLVIASFLFAWKAHRLQTELQLGAPRVQAIAARRLIRNEQLTSTGKRLKPATLAERYLLLFVTTPLDCAPCRDELSTLESIADFRPDIAVVALASGSSRQEIEQTKRSYGLSFPFLEDPSGKLLDSLQLPATPWKIVFDLATDRILMEDSRSITDDEKRAFLTRLSQL